MFVLKHFLMRCMQKLRQGGWIVFILVLTIYHFNQAVYYSPEQAINHTIHEPSKSGCLKLGTCNRNQTYLTDALGLGCDRKPVKSKKITLPNTALLSAPGSGNTWARWLIQRLTGICTGSIYHDKDLKKNGFPCEGLQKDVIAVKTHILDHFPSDKVILLIRNPYDAVLADFNRAYSGSNHTGVVQMNTVTLAYLREKVRMFCYTWLESVASALASKELLVVFYESLKNDTRKELQRIAEFLLVKVDDARIGCVLDSSAGNAKRQSRPKKRMDVFLSSEKSVIDALIGAAKRMLRDRGIVDIPGYFTVI